MKKNTLISFIVNILASLLFCFPVFSAEALVIPALSKKGYQYINEPAIYKAAIAGSKFKTKLTKLTKWKKPTFENISSEKKLSIKKPDPGFLKLISLNSYSLLSQFNVQFKDFLQFTYVNLAFLKELKVIKMLC